MREREEAGKAMRVVTRSLSVLSLVGKYSQGLTLQEIHDRVDIPLSSLHRILQTLAEEDFVFRSPVNRKFYLGARAKELAATGNFDSYLIPPPTPIVDAANESGETVFLTQLIGNRVVCVSLVEARHRLRLTVDIGKSVPLFNAASARIILAHLDRESQTRVLQAEEQLSGTRRADSQQKLLEHLQVVKAQGFDFCAGELDEGVWAVSAPVFDATGRISLGVTLAAAATRVTDAASKAQALDTAMRAADQLSRANGYQGDYKPRPRVGALSKAFMEDE